MPTYLHRVTKELLVSVSQSDVASPADYIESPDLSAVEGFASKYWTITGDIVTLKSEANRASVDVVEKAAALLEDKASEKLRLDTERVIRALALVTMDEINILRDLHSLPLRTASQLLNAIEAKIDSI